MTDFLLDIGGRDEQQDSCDIFQSSHSILLVLCDGMGGHSGGEVASHTFVAKAKSAYSKRAGRIKDPQAFFQKIADQTTAALTAYVEKHPRSNPHTTCVLALIQDEKLYVGHVGDSRMYLYVDKKFTLRSRDHSVVQMLLNDGEISEEEMADHPEQNKLLKSVSSKKETNITYKEYDLPKDKSNAVLVCSDGFWEQLSTDEMQSQLFGKPLSSALKSMLATAKERGGSRGDNISVAAYVETGSENVSQRGYMAKISALMKRVFS